MRKGWREVYEFNFFFLLIIRVIYDIVVNKLNKEEALERLMTRELEPEFPFAQPNF